MISIYGRRQMIDKANEIVNYMNESGVTPSLTTYNSLMYMYSRSSNYERAEEILNDLVSRGRVKPDVISYNTVIYAYCRNGRMKEASRMFKKMAESGVAPDVITYNTFVGSYAADAMFVEAIDVVRYMIRQGCRPNQSTYNSIVDWYCKLAAPYSTVFDMWAMGIVFCVLNDKDVPKEIISLFGLLEESEWHEVKELASVVPESDGLDLLFNMLCIYPHKRGCAD
ncbi:hypothetical protein ACP275_02G056900 [Erythranthe tilingii]